ncbi:ATP-binding domain-containing protein [Nostoc sp. FACHB-133]|uniref:ATP-binding domain-containing protein n=1 Tax=Nostoc sp. FACHB-133 TaxID=2692835 RepID=UPI0034D97B8D
MEVTVQYRKHTVVRTRADLNQIALAWSLTIHQSQVSEYPVVILPIYTQPYMMLSRKQLYTALTCANQLAIVVGSKKAISKALRSSDGQLRYTRLQQRLESAFLHPKIAI